MTFTRRAVGAWTLFVMAAVVWMRPAKLWSGIDYCKTSGLDFIGYYQQGEVLFRKPLVIVDGWLYPPLAAIFFWVFKPLGQDAATILWAAINVALAMALAVLCADQLRSFGRWARWAAAIGLVAASLPVVHCIKWGQVSLLVAVGAIVALRFRRGGASLLAFLIALKLYPAGYLLAPAARRDWRTLVRVFAWTLLWAIVVPVVVLGFGETRTFYEGAFRATMKVGTQNWARDHSVAWYGGAGLAPALSRWFRDGGHVGLNGAGAPPLLFPLPAVAFVSLSAALALLVLGVSAWRLWRGTLDRAPATALCLTALALVMQPAWHHYFAFLPFAQAVSLSRRKTLHTVLAVASWAISCACLVLLPDHPLAYFEYSAWGGTTIACLLVFCSLAFTPA
jgi:hypothetical protein